MAAIVRRWNAWSTSPRRRRCSGSSWPSMFSASRPSVLGRTLRIRSCVRLPALAGSRAKLLMVLQQCRAGVMRDGEPCAADDRQLDAQRPGLRPACGQAWGRDWRETPVTGCRIRASRSCPHYCPSRDAAASRRQARPGMNSHDFTPARRMLYVRTSIIAGERRLCAAGRHRVRTESVGTTAEVRRPPPTSEPYNPINSRSFFTVSATSSASSVVRTVISPVRLCKTL